jgi:uncharacterized protein involved in exopolysaccharide biosynthesis
MLFRHETFAFRLADIFFRNWLTFVLCVVGVTGVVSTALLMRAQSYVATTSIHVTRDDNVSQAMGFTQQSWISPAQQHVNAFNDFMQGVAPGGFVSKVLERAKIGKPINIDPEAKDPRFTRFRKGVFATAASNDVFQIGLTWDNPVECERLVEALRACFLDTLAGNQQAGTVATKSFLDSQIVIYKKRLEEAENALSEYKRLNHGNLPDSTQASLEQLANLRMERDYLVITSQDNALKRETIQQRIAQIKPVNVLEQTVTTDPLVLQMRELEAKRNSLLAQDWLPTSDPVQELGRQIEQLKKLIMEQAKADPLDSKNVIETKLQDNPEYLDLTQQLTQVAIDERAQKARIDQLSAKIHEYDERVKLLPAAERKLVEKTRDSDVIRKQYNDLWERREQAQLKANVERVTAMSRYQIFNNPYAEQTLGKTKKAFMVIASTVLGMIVGCLMLLLKEWADPSLRYETDVVRLLGVPVLASLPESSVLQFPVSKPRRGLLGGNRGSAEPVAALAAPGFSGSGKKHAGNDD